VAKKKRRRNEEEITTFMVVIYQSTEVNQARRVAKKESTMQIIDEEHRISRLGLVSADHVTLSGQSKGGMRGGYYLIRQIQFAA